jgi:hypothetical protein
MLYEAGQPFENPLMNKELAQRVYAVLVDVCGASNDERSQWRFEDAFEGDHPASQYRFEGSLGYGGKFFFPSFSVSYYCENQTPEGDETCKRANALLEPLRAEYFESLQTA